MKQKLIEGAERIGFTRSIIMEVLMTSLIHDKHKNHDTAYFLWMHELKRWFKTEHDIDAWAQPCTIMKAPNSDGSYSFSVHENKRVQQIRHGFSFH